MTGIAACDKSCGLYDKNTYTKYKYEDRNNSTWLRNFETRNFYLITNLARGKNTPFQFVNVCFNKQKKKTLRFWVIQDFAISYSTACSSSNQSSAKEAGSEVDNLRWNQPVIIMTSFMDPKTLEWAQNSSRFCLNSN